VDSLLLYYDEAVVAVVPLDPRDRVPAIGDEGANGGRQKRPGSGQGQIIYPTKPSRQVPQAFHVCILVGVLPKG